jgi:hypothetical protein
LDEVSLGVTGAPVIIRREDPMEEMEREGF